MPLSQGSGTHDVHEVTIPNVGFMLVHSWATCFSKFTWVFTLCSLEAKHSVKGIAEMTLKLTNDLHGALQLCATSSHTRECTHWGWTYRNGSSEEQCLGLEWRHEVSPEKYFAVQASTKNWRWKLCADMHMPSGTAPKFRTLSL
jgi:hypothetical protein